MKRPDKQLRARSLLIVVISLCFANLIVPCTFAAEESVGVLADDQVGADTKTGAVHKIVEKPPFKIANFLSRNFQKYSGFTGSSEFLIDRVLVRLLKKLFGGKISVKVRSYSFTDLLHMKVRLVKVRLVGSHYKKDVPLGIVEVESKTPIWFVLIKRRRLDVKYPVLFSFKMQITEEELEQILRSERVTHSLHALRLDLASLGSGLGEQRLQMYEPVVTLEDNSIIVKTKLSTQNADPSTASSLTISGQPKLYGDDRIFLENVYVDSVDITEPEKFSKFVENLINPLINLHRFDKPNFALRLDEISVQDKKVLLRGRVIIGPKIPS